LHPLYAYITATVGASLERPTRLIVGSSFDQILTGEVDFAFLCGLPYIRLAALDPCPVLPLAAPVLAPARYLSRPVYYSDVIVTADLPVSSFEQLQGKSWAYNEPDSHSGYLLTLYHLLSTGRTPDFFARRVRTDFHANSIRAVASGLIDASAVDSQVLAVVLRDSPELTPRLRVIDSFGPSTIQPLVAAARLPLPLREDVKAIVTSLTASMHPPLARALVHHFVPIEDSQYDDIRAMLKAVEAHHLHF
jgi:phosphonate transport system substrate-binding protein